MKQAVTCVLIAAMTLTMASPAALAGRWLQQVGHDRDDPDILIMSGETPRQQYRSDTHDYLEVVIDTNGNGRIDRSDGSFVESVRGRFSIRLNIAGYHGCLAEITLWDRKESELVGQGNSGFVVRRGYSVYGRHDGMRDTLR